MVGRQPVAKKTSSYRKKVRGASYGPLTEPWSLSQAKYGWSLRINQKNRTIAADCADVEIGIEAKMS